MTKKTLAWTGYWMGVLILFETHLYIVFYAQGTQGVPAMFGINYVLFEFLYLFVTPFIIYRKLYGWYGGSSHD